mgnify:FL=1
MAGAFAGANANAMQPTGSTYTGVNETVAGRKPGITKSRVMVSYGVYETLPVKLALQYHGFSDEEPCEHPLKVNITF